MKQVEDMTLDEVAKEFKDDHIPFRSDDGKYGYRDARGPRASVHFNGHAPNDGQLHQWPTVKGFDTVEELLDAMGNHPSQGGAWLDPETLPPGWVSEPDA